MTVEKNKDDTDGHIDSGQVQFPPLSLFFSDNGHPSLPFSQSMRQLLSSSQSEFIKIERERDKCTISSSRRRQLLHSTAKVTQLRWFVPFLFLFFFFVLLFTTSVCLLLVVFSVVVVAADVVMMMVKWLLLPSLLFFFSFLFAAASLSR